MPHRRRMGKWCLHSAVFLTSKLFKILWRLLLYDSHVNDQCLLIFLFSGYFIAGAPRGLGDLGKRAIYFQGAGEHCLLF